MAYKTTPKGNDDDNKMGGAQGDLEAGMGLTGKTAIKKQKGSDNGFGDTYKDADTKADWQPNHDMAGSSANDLMQARTVEATQQVNNKIPNLEVGPTYESFPRATVQAFDTYINRRDRLSVILGWRDMSKV